MRSGAVPSRGPGCPRRPLWPPSPGRAALPDLYQQLLAGRGRRHGALPAPGRAGDGGHPGAGGRGAPARAASVKVELEDIGPAYRREAGLRGVSIDLPEGGVTVVIGPSGAGKSTLLQITAGLLRPAAGRVLFDRRDVARVPAERRDVGVVFQSYALFPHLSVRGNIAFGLRTANRRLPSREVEGRVEESAALVGLTSLLERRPGELSGGGQQPGALARARPPPPALLRPDQPLQPLRTP